MQTPIRKKKRTYKNKKHIIALLLLIALLAAGFGLWYAKVQESLPYAAPDVPLSSQTLWDMPSSEIASIAVEQQNEESYVLTQQNGALWLPDALQPIDASMADDIFSALSPLVADDVITDDITPYQDHLDDFGLASPFMTLTVTNTAGKVSRIIIGDMLHETERRYFLIEGDKRLYACSTPLYTSFNFDYHLFYAVEQPTLFSSYIDSILLQTGDGKTCFEYRLADGFTYNDHTSDAAIVNSFFLSEPVRYPAQSEWIKPFLTALENFILGPIIAKDTSDNRIAYGLEPAEYILTVHQREGFQNTTDSQGTIVRTLIPETTHTFFLGDEHDEVTRYLAANGEIHLFNAFQLSFVYDLNALETLVRQPLNIPIDLLSSLIVDDDVYEIKRVERLKANNEFETDANGNILYDVSVTQNGLHYDYDLFKSRYEKLMTITVSGNLPQDFIPSAHPTQTICILLTTGESREITLTPYDNFHNAIGIDGVYLHYLIKGGLTF